MDDTQERWILVAEDEDQVRRMYEAVLADAGYRVRSARSGQEALEALSGGLRPLVVVTDLDMPALDGHALRAALRQDPELASLPVIVSSAKEDPRGQPPFDPRDGFLRKPARVWQLRDLIRSMMRG